MEKKKQQRLRKQQKHYLEVEIIQINAPKIEVTDEDFSKELLDVLVDRKILKTKSEGRRLIEQNGMSLNDEKITDVKFTLNENTLGLLKLGKKKFYNIVKK